MSVITNPTSGGGGGITQLTGDVTAGPGSGSQASTLATVNANTGLFGDATHVGQFTVNGKGLITSAANVAISGGGGGMAIGGAVTGGTTGSVLFIGAGPVLAQDNSKFNWDDSNFILNLGAGLVQINDGTGTNALYIDNITTGNVFIYGGRKAATGLNNVAIGNGAGTALTTGLQNMAIGAFALQATTSGARNVAVGMLAGRAILGGTDNFALGWNSLGSLISGSFNIGVGSGALQNMLTHSDNVAIGTQAFLNLEDSLNVAIGDTCAHNTTSGQYCVYIGAQTAIGLGSGTGNTFIGGASGFNITSGDYNTLIGNWEGPSGAISGVIAITDGHAVASNFSKVQGVDYNYTAATTWSFQNLANTIGLHIYNTTDGGAPPTNYERACLDWNLTSNTFRLASQAGGTGVTRLIAIDGFSKAGAPANTDLPSGSFALIDDTSGNQTWLVFNKGGTIRKVQLT